MSEITVTCRLKVSRRTAEGIAQMSPEERERLGRIVGVRLTERYRRLEEAYLHLPASPPGEPGH